YINRLQPGTGNRQEAFSVRVDITTLVERQVAADGSKSKALGCLCQVARARLEVCRANQPATGSGQPTVVSRLRFQRSSAAELAWVVEREREIGAGVQLQANFVNETVIRLGLTYFAQLQPVNAGFVRPPPQAYTVLLRSPSGQSCCEAASVETL